MTIPEILEYLDHAETKRKGWGSNFIDTSFETMPSEYIGFAEEDLDSFLEHNYINALSNAKRALDCQADRLLKLLGFYKQSQDKFWGFPKKIEKIQSFEIIAPRVLNKVNKARNLMEHQYVKPKNEDVEDFLDIVSLFIASTDQYTTSFRNEIHYENEGDNKFRDYPTLNITIDQENCKLVVYIGSNMKYPNMMKYEFNTNDIEYVEIFKRHLKKIRFL
jgi:hypothetical protein